MDLDFTMIDDGNFSFVSARRIVNLSWNRGGKGKPETGKGRECIIHIR